MRKSSRRLYRNFNSRVIFTTIVFMSMAAWRAFALAGPLVAVATLSSASPLDLQFLLHDAAELYPRLIALC